ncbi:hypothetical protein [Roseateles toxinivorans]|uniref:Integral membrane protein n=1 Tax=Roseateles toxinivorans TaxID=270368 RepID=A0A4R6QJ27_9BURK|nr:hypothetical protein [Roseateles toxinivorans]TDP62740.1 hypothetical protein DES47_10635 [Roseateles toxinivorans]
MLEFAALLFALIVVGVSAFQVALAMGAPWGEFTLGGRWRGRLPMKVRVIPLVSLLLLLCFGAVILARAGFLAPFVHQRAHSLAWVVVGYCALGTIVNAITPSRRERNLWLPVLFCMLILSLVVATS